MENKGYKVIEYVRLDFDQSESRISQTWPNWNELVSALPLMVFQNGWRECALWFFHCGHK